MRSFVVALFVVAFVFCLSSVTVGQTPSNAINLYKHGTSKLDKNDLDGAIDDFTKAIETEFTPRASESRKRS